MKKNRKDDQSYEDRYDRSTIEILKNIEKEKGDLKKYPLIEIADKTLDYSLVYRIKYRDTGALRDQRKKETIENWKREDEQKDDTIERYSPPPIRDCKECNVRMHFKDYYFKDNYYEVIFAYDCPKKKDHRKLYFNNGVEYIPKKRLCALCGGQLASKTKRSKLKLVITDTCKECGNFEKDEYDMTPDIPIDENERKYYCTYFKGNSTFMQDLKKIADLKVYIDNTQSEKDKNKEFEVHKIEKLKVSKLEGKLKSALEPHGFVKFQFEKTKIDRFVIAEFSVQDTSDREGRESIKVIKKFLEAELFTTNWRLMASDIDCRLGIITGKIKGFEDDESILKIAKEVKEKKNKEHT